MKEEERQRISRLMSYLLRHHPEQGGLKPDGKGMVLLHALLEAIQSRPGYQWVTMEDIRFVVATCPKQRFLLEGDRIGARYGHSARLKPIDPGKPTEPPEVLYHGTPRRHVRSILRNGLNPMDRQYVHLSTTPEVAAQVGKRRDSNPAILLIEARKAYKEGIPFYRATQEIYLVLYIPAIYLKKLDPR